MRWVSRSTTSLLALPVLGLLAAGCKVSVGPADANAAIPGATPLSVGKGEYKDLKTGKVDKGAVEVTLPEIGTLAPVVKVEVKSVLSGRIVKLLVKEGDHVEVGQPLAVLEPSVDQLRDLASISSGVESSDLELKDAKIDYDNTVALKEKGFASNDQLKAADKRVKQAQISYEAAVAQRNALSASGVPIGDAAAALKSYSVVAPSGGTVLEKKVQPGEVVTSGTSSFNGGTVLFSIADAKALKVDAFINEVDLGKIGVGYPVKVTVDAFRGQEFKARVATISPAARKEGEIRGFDVEIRMEGDTGPLRPGMTANVDIKGEAKKDVVRIPIEALMKDKGDDVVWVMKEGKPERQPVKSGLVSIDWVEVLDGVAPGTDIALQSPSAYLDDQKEKAKHH